MLQTPLMPCPAVCCMVSEAVCPYNGKSDTGTGKLCFSVSVGVAYGTGQIVTVKGERVEISARKYYPYLDWLKAERLLLLGTVLNFSFSRITPFSHKTKTISNYRESPTLNCCRYRNPPRYHHSPYHGEQAGSIVTVW